jgi:hypothetical protein
MEKVSIHGKMEESMKENIKMIKKMDMEFIVGLMERNTMVTGLMANNMDKGYLFLQMEQSGMASGKKGSVLSG